MRDVRTTISTLELTQDEVFWLRSLLTLLPVYLKPRQYSEEMRAQVHEKMTANITQWMIDFREERKVWP